MTSSGAQEAHEHGEATATMLTGIEGQTLVLDGWFASHADCGRPGPHVHLSDANSEMRGAVLKTSQVPELIECLELVTARIEDQWRNEAEEYLQDFPAAPDPNDPEVVRQRRIEHLECLDKLAAHFAEVGKILSESEDLHVASARIAALIDLTEEDVEGRLHRVNLFSLTQAASRHRAAELEELRGE